MNDDSPQEYSGATTMMIVVVSFYLGNSSFSPAGSWDAQQVKKSNVYNIEINNVMFEWYHFWQELGRRSVSADGS